MKEEKTKTKSDDNFFCFTGEEESKEKNKFCLSQNKNKTKQKRMERLSCNLRPKTHKRVATLGGAAAVTYFHVALEREIRKIVRTDVCVCV